MVEKKKREEDQRPLNERIVSNQTLLGFFIIFIINIYISYIFPFF